MLQATGLYFDCEFAEIQNKPFSRKMIYQKLSSSSTSSPSVAVANKSLIKNENFIINDNKNDNQINYDEYQIDLKQATNRTINFVQFCQFEAADNILACCIRERIFIYQISIDNQNEFNYKLIYDYICATKCSTLTFGPRTNFADQLVLDSGGQKNLHKGYLSLAVATDDFGILLFNQSIHYHVNDEDKGDDDDDDINKLNDTIEQQFYTGHFNYVNSLAFEPINGDQLASTGDDCTCIIRSLHQNNANNQISKIQLSSAGINVKWHPTEPNKLLVSEKKGIIRFYDTITLVAVLSFDCNHYPLTSSDWCLENNSIIGCTSDHDLYFWDTSLTSLPMKIMKTNYECLQEFSFYNDKLIAYRGRPLSFLTVKNFITNQTYIERNLIAGHGVSWNRSLPLLAVGGPKHIHLFKFNIF